MLVAATPPLIEDSGKPACLPENIRVVFTKHNSLYHFRKPAIIYITIGGRMNMKTLKQASIGDTVKVVKLHGEGAVKRRIMDMGITRGIEVYIRKVAPLGDPIEVTVRGYELSLRKADAEMIEVE
jgi:ferrous iron transport protein A